MNSLRMRLMVFLLATILPLIAASSTVMYVYTAQALDREFNGNLLSKLHTFARMAEWDDGDDDEGEIYIDHGDDEADLLRFEFAELALPEFDFSRNAEYYQVTDASGLIYTRSPSLEGAALLEAADITDGGEPAHVILPDGRRGRIATLRFEPSVDEDATIPAGAPEEFYLTMARATQDLSTTLAVLRNAMMAGGALTMVLAGLLIWRVTDRGLAPLAELSQRLRTAGPEDLSKRFDSDQAASELEPVYARLNELLERVELTMERERRFASDVAHELRNPIAELRSLAEVCLARDIQSDRERSSYQDTLDIALRMQRLVTALLELSRWSSGELGIDIRRVDVEKLIHSVWQPLESEASDKELSVSFNLEHPLEVQTDPVILGMIVSNLLSNAVAYTPEGGKISVDVAANNGTVCVDLSNTTDDLAPADLPNLFEKFWRKDRSDRGNNAHFGLGLPLVAALSKALGVRVESSVPSRGQFRVRVLHPVQ